MVLEEATSPYEPTAQAYDTPTSDLDPYASSSSSSSSLTHLTIAQPSPGQPLSLDLQTLPQPLVILSAQRTESLKKGIEATCLWGQKVANRPLRQEEAEAFAYHWAHSMQVASYGTPIGAALGTAWAYTRKGYHFPAWKGPGADGSKLSPDAFGPLRGASARMLWQGLRFSSYGFVGLLFGQLFFASYALTLHAANRALDPRLKDFTEALRARQKEGVAEAVGREVQAEARDLRRGETFEMARQRRSVQMAQQGRGKSQGGDDMSPTGGAFTEDFMQTTDPNEMMSDGQSRDQQFRTDTASNTFGLANETPASSPAAESRSAGMTQSSQSQQQQQQSQQSQRSSSQSQRPASGSAWDRLRQNALSGTSSPTPNTRSASSSTNAARNTDDGYTFSSSEEERQLARPQAQQEFDARIERERQGRDFGGGENGGGGGGWRKG